DLAGIGRAIRIGSRDPILADGLARLAAARVGKVGGIVVVHDLGAQAGIRIIGKDADPGVAGALPDIEVAAAVGAEIGGGKEILIFDAEAGEFVAAKIQLISLPHGPDVQRAVVGRAVGAASA